MPKILSREKKYIAPQILGWLDENGRAHVKDERTDKILVPCNIDDKIFIYERQVNDWFLKPATRYTKGKNNGFIVLMICMSYLEGVEQYIKGESSDDNSKKYFTDSIRRIYPNKFCSHDLNDLYKEARCGLFHDGMVRGKITIDYSFPESLLFENYNKIKVNPEKLLKDIKADFHDFINKLKTKAEPETETEIRIKFNRMYLIE